VLAVGTQTESDADGNVDRGGVMIASDEILRVEEYKIERFIALGLGRYDAIRAVEAGIDWHTVEQLVNEKHCPLPVALEIAR
jgi:hypothetical protein